MCQNDSTVTACSTVVKAKVVVDSVCGMAFRLRGDGTGVCVAILSIDGAAPTAVKSPATPCELKNGPVLLTYRAVNGSAPVYLSSYFHPSS